MDENNINDIGRNIHNVFGLVIKNKCNSDDIYTDKYILYTKTTIDDQYHKIIIKIDSWQCSLCMSNDSDIRICKKNINPYNTYKYQMIHYKPIGDLVIDYDEIDRFSNVRMSRISHDEIVNDWFKCRKYILGWECERGEMEINNDMWEKVHTTKKADY